ncbi:tetratricopeptide repeat protein [Glaciihabitans sp. dw_435]|uniref:tetratricopeptide repeat protein n=1 Tax=Glaciihabitans sp. dw_435 TaxID=2720081 RepID=UPI002103CAE5|nr:tetratricopeptide repeat protein [Glaciihabitans sp. dw_435]
MSTSADEDWERAVADLWSMAARISPAILMETMTDLASHRPHDDAAALFELASACDFADHETEAEPLYRRALDAGLTEPRRGRALIQLASTLRNLGRPTEAIDLLQDGFAATPGHPLSDAARAFLALCLADTGQQNLAIAVALDALSGHLPEYANAVRRYANDLTR